MSPRPFPPPGYLRRVALQADAWGTCRPVASGPVESPASGPETVVARLVPALATARRTRPVPLIPTPAW